MSTVLYAWSCAESSVIRSNLPHITDFCRAMLCKRGFCRHAVCVCLCVCVSVTFVNAVKTNKHIFNFLSPSDSRAILVFLHQTAWQYSDRNPPPTGASNAGGVGSNRDSEPISAVIAAIGQVLSTRVPRRRRTTVPQGGDWKCGSGKCDTVKIARVENAGVSRMERQPEIILRQP